MFLALGSSSRSLIALFGAAVSFCYILRGEGKEEAPLGRGSEVPSCPFSTEGVFVREVLCLLSLAVGGKMVSWGLCTVQDLMESK